MLEHSQRLLAPPVTDQCLLSLHAVTVYANDIYPMAYFLVHSREVSSYFGRFVLYMCAISGTRGSSGLGSVNKEQIDSSTCRK